jgi:tRNA (guanine-N7-)-methyltransferase
MEKNNFIGYKKVHGRTDTPPATTAFEKMEAASQLFSQNWLETVKDKPLFIDIGMGMGRFLMHEVEKNPHNAYIGIDPDYQCVKKNLQKLANRAKKGIPVDHVNVFYGSVYQILPMLPKKSIDTIYISYPDPWFKRRHLKRRLVKKELFESLKPLLKNNASIYVQTDIDDYAKFIDSELAELQGFEIQFESNSLFEEFTTTLYQEKAIAKNHSRHCYFLKNIES